MWRTLQRAAAAFVPLSANVGINADTARESVRHKRTKAIGLESCITLSPARKLAYDVLHKVHHGGYASDLLRDGAKTMDSRDAGLAESIVLGCLRQQSQLLLACGRSSDVTFEGHR